MSEKSAAELSSPPLTESTVHEETVDDNDEILAEKEDGESEISPSDGSLLADDSQRDDSAPADAEDSEKKPATAATRGEIKTPDEKKESGGHVASHSSKQLTGSSKLEDQINLQHLVELMKIFYVSGL